MNRGRKMEQDKANDKVVTSSKRGKIFSRKLWINLILVVAVFSLLMLILLVYLMPFTHYHDDQLLLCSEVVDGHNINESVGCFFTLKAHENTQIDPERLSFYVAEKEHSPIKLDLGIRTYDGNGNPSGGDRNGTYDWTADNQLWTEGEYIGFDMPTIDMNISIVDGNIYEVIIKNLGNKVIFRDKFVYTCQGGS